MSPLDGSFLSVVQTFCLLIFGHFLGDYALQNDFIAKAKNRFNPVPGVPWYHALGAHSVIHGGIVGIITGSVVLGIFETICHFKTDDCKCAGKLTFNQDQATHIIHKIFWILYILTFPSALW